MRTSPPSLLALLAACFMIVSCLAYSSILKMEAICSSETLVDFHPTTRRYIPEDITLFLATAVRTSNSTVHIPWYSFSSILVPITNNFCLISAYSYYFNSKLQKPTVGWTETNVFKSYAIFSISIQEKNK
jgi:hypothetical protein